jgi:hypothetical protein
MVLKDHSKRRLVEFVMGTQKTHQIHVANVENWQEESQHYLTCRWGSLLLIPFFTH